MAAGLTVDQDKLGNLMRFVDERLRNSASAVRDGATLEINGAFTPQAANCELMTLLKRAGVEHLETNLIC